MHTSTYYICVKGIENDRKRGTHKMTMTKLNLFLANDSITEEEYAELVGMLKESE